MPSSACKHLVLIVLCSGVRLFGIVQNRAAIRSVLRRAILQDARSRWVSLCRTFLVGVLRGIAVLARFGEGWRVLNNISVAVSALLFPNFGHISSSFQSTSAQSCGRCIVCKRTFNVWLLSPDPLWLLPYRGVCLDHI